MDTAQTDDAMTRRFIDALHDIDRDGGRALDAMVALFSDDATIANATLDLAGEERSGAEGVHAFWSDYCRSLAGAQTSFHAVTRSAEAVGLFWKTRWPGSADGGGEASYEGATLLRLASGGDRFASMRGYFDTRALKPATSA